MLAALQQEWAARERQLGMATGPEAPKPQYGVVGSYQVVSPDSLVGRQLQPAACSLQVLSVHSG